MPQLISTITCPVCGHEPDEAKPTDACQFLYNRKNCGCQMKSKAGDCYAFCSYETAAG